VTTATPPEAAAAAMSEVLAWDAEARERCRTWDDALTRLRENAEAAGVLVMISGIVGSDTHRKLDPGEFRGFALADPYAALVFINGADSKAAQVFTLAHELAHLWLGETALSDLDPASLGTNAVERWCNQVAAELLAPMNIAERSNGGNCHNTKPVQVSERFARALVASALEGQTPYTQAFRLLGLKKASTFESLADRLGVTQ
jgi:Zn-dependent peptidase ImmA (M78 family)